MSGRLLAALAFLAGVLADQPGASLQEDDFFSEVHARIPGDTGTPIPIHVPLPLAGGPNEAWTSWMSAVVFSPGHSGKPGTLGDSEHVSSRDVSRPFLVDREKSSETMPTFPWATRDNNLVGAERCLSSDAPFWCLAEETSAGLARVFSANEVSGKGGSSFDLFADLAASTFDLGFSSGSDVEDETRSKKRKRFAYVFMAMATALAVLLPVKLKAIAVMAATALFVGKLALIIASLVGLKKLVHKPSEETTHVHYSGHRSDPDSHYLAYGEHVPHPEQTY